MDVGTLQCVRIKNARFIKVRAKFNPLETAKQIAADLLKEWQLDGESKRTMQLGFERREEKIRKVTQNL